MSVITASNVASPALVKVATAGTRVPLTTEPTKIPAVSIVIQALAANTKEVVVGDKTVKAEAATRHGIGLEKKERIALAVADPAVLWLDSEVNGEGVTYMLLTT